MPSKYSSNGHYYELNSFPSSFYVGIGENTTNQWQEATSISSASYYRGLQGYLATITDSGENDFVASVVGEDVAYLGASDASSQGSFKWVTGPEAGLALSYSNWYPGEPSNSRFGTEPSLSAEDAITISNDSKWLGRWWDSPAYYGEILGTNNRKFVTEYGGLTPTYSVSSSADSVNEGGSLTFTIDTTNVEWGTSLAYSISGMSTTDLSSGVLSGTANVVKNGNNGRATVSISLAEDSVTEGSETLTFSVQDRLSSVSVNDTSTGSVTEAMTSAAPTFTISTTTSSVDEGSQVSFEVSTTNVAEGTALTYVISGISDVDLDEDALTGSILVSSDGKAQKSFSIANDLLTEGSETLTFEIKDQSASVVINDTSLTSDRNTNLNLNTTYEFTSDRYYYDSWTSNYQEINSLVFSPGIHMLTWHWLTLKKNNTDINYSFNLDPSLNTADYSSASDWISSHQPLSASYYDTVHGMLDYVDSITGLNHVYTENHNEADLFFLFGTDTTQNSWGAYANGNEISRQQELNYDDNYWYFTNIDYEKYIVLNQESFSIETPPAPHQWRFQTILHEIGHVLGLNHPHEDMILDSSLDNTDITVMSYKKMHPHKTEFQPLDIQALHFLYGGDGVGGTYGVLGKEPDIDSNPSESYLVYAGLEDLYALDAADFVKERETKMELTLNTQNQSFLATSQKTKLDVSGSKESYTIEKVGSAWQISGSDIGTDTLSGFKRLEFSDGTLAIDIDAGDTAGQAYRLYQAAFARTPDMPGVAYHMNDMEGNGLALENVANNFIASPEFKTKYGENPSDDVFIDLLYQNVLGRSADADGLAFYTNHFTAGTMTRAAALIGFAESPENVSLVAPQIEDGIWLAS